MLDGLRGRRLRKLMFEQNTAESAPKYGFHIHRKKEILADPEMVEERNEVIEKRCCICLEEMRAKT